jgi:hypothetical protein
MSGQRVAQEDDGWGMVFVVALLGLTLAALVVLTPWHLSDLSGQRKGPQSARDSVIKVVPAKDLKATVPTSGGARQFLSTSF